MGALVQHLESIIAREGSAIELIRALEDELSGGDLLESELRAGRAAFSEATARERDVNQGKYGADALAGASRGGLYLPHEIPDLAASHAADPTWVVRESVRFLCFEVALRELNSRADRRSLGPEDYASAATELATRVSRVRMHPGRRS